MPAPTHFEIPADDTERVQKFYGSLFGWQFQTDPNFDYTFISTKTFDGKDGLSGGVYKRQDPAQRTTNYIDVESIEDSMKKVEELKGKVVTPKMSVKGMGHFAQCVDTEGNSFGLWQNDPNAE
jgi:uncharacterized protein